MPIKQQSIIKQDFDSKVFNIPYYRIYNYDIDLVENELIELKKHFPIIIDAKINSDNKKWDLFLQKYDFKKVCMQVELIKKVVRQESNDIVIINNSVSSLNDDIICRHSKNFIYDRFSLDVRIDPKPRNNLFYTWIKNSLSNKKVYKVHLGESFCTFKIKSNIIIIDLISVLDKNKNIGSKLLSSVEHYAYKNNIDTIKVVTECENWGAYNFYIKNNYVTSSYKSCFHYISLSK